VLTLAGNETKIQLVLRNTSDKTITTTSGRKLQELYKFKGGRPAERSGESGDEERPVRRARPRPRPVEVAQAVIPAPAPPPVPDQVVVIRGTQKTVEVVNNGRPMGAGRN